MACDILYKGKLYTQEDFKKLLTEGELESILKQFPDILNIKANAIQKPSAKSVLQREQREAGEAGGRREGVESVEQRVETAEKAKKAESDDEEIRQLHKLANNVPDTGKVDEYLSKGTIEKYTSEKPTNDQSRGVQELSIALEHGEKIIEKAKEIFGEDYVEKTLDYIENSTASTSNKALMYVSLENALGKEKLLNPQKAADITKQQALVYSKSQAFARESSLALNYQKLRRVAKIGYDSSKVVDGFFTTKEKDAKVELEEAIEATPEKINAEAESQEKGVSEDVAELVKKEVEKEIDKIYQKMPSNLKKKADAAISALEKAQSKLRNKFYDAGLGVPVAIIDYGITTIKLAIKAGVKIADAIELGISKIREKYGKEWNESEFRKDMTQVFQSVKQEKNEIKDVVKEALIKKGFGREITITENVVDENGNVSKVKKKKEIIDWRKLAGAAGTVSKISENVADVIKGKYSDSDIKNIQKEFIDEYISLRASIIEKAQNEIAKRNKEVISPDRKSAAKKLAELYAYGLFESKADEFEFTLSRALGLDISEETFYEVKKIAKGLESLYESSFKGVKFNDISAKTAINQLEDRLRVLLFKEQKKKGNFSLRATSLLRNYFDLQQTMILNNLKQAIENPLSGYQQLLIDKINSISGKTSTKELSQQRKEMMKTLYKDMILNGQIGYGKTESAFVTRARIDDYINSLSDSQLYHGIASVATGKTTLNAMDAMFKLGLTEMKFVGNLIKVLTHETNPNRMSKADALQFVSERLTGQTLADAKKTAEDIIQKINIDAGSDVVPNTQEAIDRLANDIVKASLEMGGKITSKQIESAYNAAYKAAGLGLGHEANNFLSSQISSYTATLESKINNALQEKEWNRASLLMAQSILFRNILNPFVGGGTNWLVLKFEKTGLGLVTGLGYQLGTNTKIDLSSDSGIKLLEKRLYNQSRIKDQYMRGVVGGIASVLTFGAFYGLGSSDEYRKWREKNRWAARYLDVVTPEFMLAEMAIKSDKAKKYVASTINKNDTFDASTKFISAVDYGVKGEKQKMWGAIGEGIGSKLNAPLPWRVVKDGVVVYQGVTGQDPYHGNYKASQGFLNGVFQGGFIEWLGYRPSPQEEEAKRGKRRSETRGEKRSSNRRSENEEED